MATSSILGGSQLPEEVSGKDMHALGPSDNSDSGSDATGAYGADELSSDSDAAGTGERATMGTGREQPDADILPDRIEQLTGVDGEDALDDTASGERVDLSNVAELEADEDDEDDEASGAA